MSLNLARARHWLDKDANEMAFETADAVGTLRPYITELEAELATLRAKGEALDKLEALVRGDWHVEVNYTPRKMLSFRLTAKGDELGEHCKYGSGPSLLEAINALPMGSEEPS